MLTIVTSLLGQCVPMTAVGGGAIYNSDVRLGTPPQTVRVVPDTGSMQLVVLSTLCTQASCLSGHAHRFDPRTSGTFAGPRSATSPGVEYELD